jgi:hypothetical protein
MARPKLPQRKIKKSVTLKEDVIKGLTRKGAGNLSAGIELVYAEMKYLADRAKEEKKTVKADDPAPIGG